MSDSFTNASLPVGMLSFFLMKLYTLRSVSLAFPSYLSFNNNILCCSNEQGFKIKKQFVYSFWFVSKKICLSVCSVKLEGQVMNRLLIGNSSSFSQFHFSGPFSTFQKGFKMKPIFYDEL